jgi:two-component system, LuxR family, sensor kinase FixL
MPNGQGNRPIDRLLGASRGRLLTVAAVAVFIIACLDWYVGETVTLGALYILPIILVSGTLSRPQILGVAALCAALRLLFNPHPTLTGLVMNGAFALLAYGIIALFAVELAENRREILRQLNEIRHQQRLRLDAEEQLRLLAESSPAAIFTLDGQARIVSANRATRELLGLPEDCSPVGRSIDRNLPVLAEALKLETGGEAFRTVAQVQGTRADGTLFLAQVCFSTYRADDRSARLAAIAFDSTEDTREREEQSQQQMLESHRIVAGAVAHEVRNVCSAMSVIYSNLAAVAGLTGNPDFQALGSLLTGLGRLAHLELHGRAEAWGGSADLRDVLNQLRILIAPAWDDEGGHLAWPDLRSPLLVAADSFTLLQAFLNIANNSLTAVSQAAVKRLAVEVEISETFAHAVFADSGPGVSDPASLFKPFRSGSGDVGIGLYVSRALLRRYGGDVRYEPASSGARFIVEVPLHGASSDVSFGNERNPALAGG